MGKGNRIRWQNVAKLTAAAVACVALVAGLPTLLERPKPPPLPADVGLAHVADGAPAASLRADHAMRHRPRRPAAHGRDEHARPERDHEVEQPPHHRAAQPDHTESPAPQPATVAAPAPAPPASSAPAPTRSPAPAHVPPPPAPATVAVTTSSSPPPPESEPVDGGGGGGHTGPPEFGFER